MFHFTHFEISTYMAGMNIPFALFSLADRLLGLGEAVGVRRDTRSLWHLLYCLLLYFIVLANFRRYRENYTNKKDDLMGNTDTVRRILKEHPDESGYKVHFKLLGEIMSPISLVLLNFAVNSICYIFMSNLFGIASNPNRDAPYQLILNIGTLLGSLLYGFLPIQHSMTIVVLSAVRLLIVFFLIINNNSKHFYLKSVYPAGFIMALFCLLGGYNCCAAFTMAANRVEPIRKKPAGFVMMISAGVGVVYGLMISVLVFQDSV